MKQEKMNVTACIDVLLDYAKGNINLQEATMKFSNFSKLSKEVSSQYICSLSRQNIIDISTAKGKK